MRLLNVLQQHADNGRASMPVGRWGTVTSGDTNRMTVKVSLQPEGLLTGWLPLASSVVGGGWGLVHVPPVGTQVFCMPDAGDDNSYVVVGATWSTGARPPAGVLQGELWLVHSTGSKIKLTNDGKITIADQSGCSLEFQNNGTALLTGALHVTGTVVAGFGSADQVSLQTHRHGTGTNAAGTIAPTAGT